MAAICAFAVMALPVLPGHAQVSGPNQGFVQPDLGPASRPTGVAPNSGLATGREARPPGDANAYGPGGWPRPSPMRVEPLERYDPPARTGRAKAKRRPPALPRARRDACARGDWRCR